jgi:hypothetical protein
MIQLLGRSLCYTVSKTEILISAYKTKDTTKDFIVFGLKKEQDH